MTTECNQATFEFHGLFQRKVKARFDGGKITSDAGVLLLREVEKRTGLIAGLEQCFTDHRDPRLIEHSVKELLGQRIYGLCLGYEDLNGHDQLRTDPMLAVAFRRREHAMLGFRRMRSLQKFVTVHSSVYNHFNLRRPLCLRDNFKLKRAAALVQWRQLGAA